MKRRSFLALALACLGIKFVPKAKAAEPVAGCLEHGTWTMLSPTFVSLESANPPVYLTDVWPEEIRMDEAGDFARKALNQELWDPCIRHRSDELE